ncbi:MAG TPA: PAS domain S-box protein [Rhodopila sp.]|nr:PAS domain S-box protein [Rhodopila sp.]
MPPAASRRRWRHRLTLRARLILLALACILPLVVLGSIREYLDYRAEQQRTYDDLLATAATVAASVERELQLDIRALETLAISKPLQNGDFEAFMPEAQAFLARLPPGTNLSAITPDQTIHHIFGLPPGLAAERLRTALTLPEVFRTGQPAVTNLRIGQVSGIPGFIIHVPVFRGGQVIYDLALWMPAAIMQDLVLRQYVPPQTVLTIADAAGKVVARLTKIERFIGQPINADMWQAATTHASGIAWAPTMEGIDAVGAFTHVQPFGWAVFVGAPADIVFADLRTGVYRLVEGVLVVVAAAVLFGSFVARGITHPIQRLRHLAGHDDQLSRSQSLATGLAETDEVAQALAHAAEERRHTAEALAESEQRFRVLFERSDGGTFLVDPETLVVVDCNESAAAFLGYARDEFRGRPITDFALSSTPEQIREMARAVLAGKSWRYETLVRGRAGPRHLLNAICPVQVGGRTLILVNQIDVSDLRRAEADLRANEERLELARQGASLGIWDWNLRDNTLTWSEHEWFLHGLEPRPEGTSPELWRHTILPSDLPRVQAELIAALKSDEHPYATEYSIRLPDGTRRRLLARGRAVRGEDGRVVRMVGINMDVTARFEAEMARDRLITMLETERARLAGIIEALPIGVGIVDADGRIILGNTRMQELIGPVIPSMADSPHVECIAEQDGMRLAPADFPIRKALAQGEPILPGREFLFRYPQGRETWMRVSAMPLRQENGKVQEALGIIQDIDAEKRLLEIQQQIAARLEQRVREEVAAREAAQQRAAQAERMHALGQIAGGIAHDFNNVLQAISGSAALIERRPNDAERVLRNIRMTLDAARRGAAITSRLLAFARRGDLRAESIDTAALLNDMAEVLTHTLGGSVVCKVWTGPDLPPLFADRGQLETVLVNLATNARDAMAAGGTLTLAAEAETVSAGLPHPAGLAAGSYVRITVGDTGTGMDQKTLARVTEPFFTTKEPGKGTGLGLAMAKGFVEQSGGSLSIDSAPGQGTRVILWLPTAGTAARAAAQDTAPALPSDRPCVLLVDDDAIVRDVLRLSLEDAGYAVRAVEGSAAALASLAAGDRVDIIVSDLSMPDMDGVALIRAAQERRPGLPAVLLTGYAGDGAALAVGGAISGTFSLLTKPVSGGQLVDRISALLAARRLGREEGLSATPAINRP